MGKQTHGNVPIYHPKLWHQHQIRKQTYILAFLIMLSHIRNAVPLVPSGNRYPGSVLGSKRRPSDSLHLQGGSDITQPL